MSAVMQRAVSKRGCGNCSPALFGGLQWDGAVWRQGGMCLAHTATHPLTQCFINPTPNPNKQQWVASSSSSGGRFCAGFPFDFYYCRARESEFLSICQVQGPLFYPHPFSGACALIPKQSITGTHMRRARVFSSLSGGAATFNSSGAIRESECAQKLNNQKHAPLQTRCARYRAHRRRATRECVRLRAGGGLSFFFARACARARAECV